MTNQALQKPPTINVDGFYLMSKLYTAPYKKAQRPAGVSMCPLKIHPEKLRDSENELNNIHDNIEPLSGPSAYGLVIHEQSPKHNSI